MPTSNLISLGGMIVLILFAIGLSTDRKRIPYKSILYGILILLAFAAFIFQVPVGTKMFLWINDGVVKILDAGMAGARFLFGPLAAPPGEKTSIGFILAFQAFPTIIFFAALMEILYHYNILPRIIRVLAKLFRKVLSISGMESLCAASNIFVGIESLTTIRPYLEKATPSEIMTLLTLGMATIASSVLGFYVIVLKDQFPNIAGHLISASLMSALAALLMAKILMPETEWKESMEVDSHPHVEKSSNVFEATIRGANAGGKLIFGIVVLLIAVLGLVALINLGLDLSAGALGNLWHQDWSLSLQDILSYIFYPFVLILGVPLTDAWEVSRLLGERLILTEITAYQNLSILIKTNALKDPRSSVLAAYALCGFTHVASMAIFAGGLSALAPNQTATITKVSWRALIAATLACLLTAAVAGVFFTKNFLLLTQAP